MGILKLLLDTHCWLWLHFDPDRLPSPLKRRCRLQSNELHLSAVSAFEIANKHAAGRLRLPKPPEQFLRDIQDGSIHALPITLEHASAAGALPPHHRDPFDRLLIAQAEVDGLTLVTADPQILRYDIPTIDARK